jgi:hypothetical protein
MLKKVPSSILHNERREKVCKSSNFREKSNDPQHRNNIVNIKQFSELKQVASEKEKRNLSDIPSSP